MWAGLPDTLVQHITSLALPAVLPALLRLEKRCYQSATERLAKLAALRREPFFVAAGTIFGADGAATTLSLENKALTDASIEVFACAGAAGAMAHLQVSSLPNALNRCLETWHACSPGLIVSFDVPYADAWAREQQYR